MAGRPSARPEGEAMPAATPGIGESVSSRAVSIGGDATQARPTLPTIGANAPFFYAFHPLRWQVLEGAIVPELAIVRIQDGVNAHPSDDPEGWRVVVQGWASRGWTVLPHDIGGDSYLAATEVEHGGLHYHNRFETCIAGSASKDFDASAFVAWLKGLMAAGTLPKPSRHALEGLANRLRKSFNAAAKDGHLHPRVKSRADRLAQAIDLVDGELAKLSSKAPRAKSKAVAIGGGGDDTGAKSPAGCAE